MKTAVLIVAGGSGTRMGGTLPKQFLPLACKPVIVHSIERFRQAVPDAGIYVALGEGMDALWQDTADKFHAGDVTVCRGGETRFHTVKSSLGDIRPCDIVLIHDAARPLVPLGVIRSVLETAVHYGTAVPVVPPVDTYRILGSDGGSSAVERARLRAVQTPQGFGWNVLKEAYCQKYSESFTDDASVVESAGYPLALCGGSHTNLKITHPEDIAIAETILTARNE